MQIYWNIQYVPHYTCIGVVYKDIFTKFELDPLIPKPPIQVKCPPHSGGEYELHLAPTDLPTTSRQGATVYTIVNHRYHKGDHYKVIIMDAGRK